MAAGEQMDVEVRHGFAAVRAVVDDDPVAGLGEAGIAGKFGGGKQQVAEQGGVSWGGQGQSWDWLARHDEDVQRGLGRDVVERHAVLIFVNERRRDVLVTDFLE